MVLCKCFEDEEVAAPLELLDVYDRMIRHQSSLASPPEGFLIKSRDHLLAMKASPTSIAFTFLEEKYRTIDFLFTDTCWLKVQCLVELIWFHSFLIIENHVVENPDETVVVSEGKDLQRRRRDCMNSSPALKCMHCLRRQRDDNFPADCRC